MASDSWIPSFTDIEDAHAVVAESAPGLLAGGFRALAPDGVDGRATLAAIIQRAAISGEADLEDRIAALICGICFEQPFRDGNKRTAFLVMEASLAQVSRFRTIGDRDAERVLLGAQQGFENSGSLANWIRVNYQ